jgi:hypothetical protein
MRKCSTLLRERDRLFTEMSILNAWRLAISRHVEEEKQRHEVVALLRRVRVRFGAHLHPSNRVEAAAASDNPFISEAAAALLEGCDEALFRAIRNFTRAEARVESQVFGGSCGNWARKPRSIHQDNRSWKTYRRTQYRVLR